MHILSTAKREITGVYFSATRVLWSNIDLKDITYSFNIQSSFLKKFIGVLFCAVPPLSINLHMEFLRPIRDMYELLPDIAFGACQYEIACSPRQGTCLQIPIR